MALYCVVTDRLQCLSLSGMWADHFSYLLKAQNKHEWWTSEGILCQPWKVSVDISSLSPLKFICSSIWFVCQTKMADSILGLVRICQSSSLQTVSWAEQWQYLYNINTVIKLNWINWLWIQSTNNQIVTLLPYELVSTEELFKSTHLLKLNWNNMSWIMILSSVKSFSFCVIILHLGCAWNR